MWLKDGSPLRDVVIVSNGTTVRSMVYLVRLNISDSASYVCRAVNTLVMVQQVESAPGYLQVQCKCVVLLTRDKESACIFCFCIAVPPSLKVGLQNLAKNESESISYFCQFTGLPSPQVRWIRVNTLNETEELENSVTRTSIATVRHDREPELGAVNSTLEITNLEKSDEGQYICTGINGVDNLIDAVDYSTAYLTIQGCCSHCLSQGCVFTFSFLHPVPPTVVLESGASTIGIRGRGITLTFRITRASPDVAVGNIQWTYINESGIKCIISSAIVHIWTANLGYRAYSGYIHHGVSICLWEY